ncbi:MAG: T9SS type A sorting domain-containing protein [Ignavibacteria bacterium]|nr:T9SS type A sorting domain-containing protein [Ignavibacteria bacterium]
MEIPNDFKLEQNYPNPFNPTTNIKFQISHNSKTVLTIFNTLGEELSVLVNDNLKPGVYEAEWNAEDYPSGVYFYSLTTDSFKEAKKMILIK